MPDSISMPGNPWRGFWSLADPKISITSAACMVVGGSLAAADGPIHWLWLAVTGAALFCMEVAKNAWGDVFDFDSGTDLAVTAADRTAFSGGKRVLVDALLTRAQTWAIAIGFGGVGVALGVWLVFGRDVPAAATELLLWLGVVGVFLGWSYHGPPLRLAYRGLGELDVVLCYGPLIALSTFVIQTGRWSWLVFWLALPLGLFTAAFLWVNEFPDYTADRATGKRNLVVQLGRQRAAKVLPWIYAAGFAVTTTVAVAEGAPQYAWGWIALPAAVFASVHVWREPETFYRHHAVQPAALLAFVLYSVGIGIGALTGE